MSKLSKEQSLSVLIALPMHPSNGLFLEVKIPLVSGAHKQALMIILRIRSQLFQLQAISLDQS
jgi:hypothetical protein